MSFTATEKPTTGGTGAYRLTQQDLDDVVAILRSGRAATSEQIKNRKLCQARAHACRHQLATAMGVSPETLASRTVVADEAADVFTYTIWLTDQAPQAPKAAPKTAAPAK